MKQVAAYVTYPGGYADPSRTTVGLGGDAVVANRASNDGNKASATKIAGDKTTCVDRNGNGKIDTYESDPVSYTHLDVYKRQELGDADIGGLAAGQLDLGFLGGVLELADGARPLRISAADLEAFGLGHLFENPVDNSPVKVTATEEVVTIVADDTQHAVAGLQ